MSVLTADDIKDAIRGNELIQPAVEDNIKGCSYDLTIGTVFQNGEIINEASVGSHKQFTVPPGGVITMLTKEVLHLPADIMATVFPINRMSSRGFLVLNPGHVDPGFRGALSIRAINLRKTDLALHLGEPVFTAIFERLAQPTVSYNANVPLLTREREVNALDVEHSPKTLSRLIQLDKDGPYPIRSEVNEMIRLQVVSLAQIREEIRTHTLSRVTLYAALVAAVAAVLTLIHQLWFANDAPRGPTGCLTETATRSLPVDSSMVVNCDK